MAEVERLYVAVPRDGERDLVAIEEPLEIRVDGEPLSVTMRTPGDDVELALGFLYGEGLIDGPRRAGLAEDLAGNVIEVEGPLLRDPGRRRFYTSSSCGVCGKGALEEVAVASEPPPPGPRVARSLLAGLPERLVQPGFERTGGAARHRPLRLRRRADRGARGRRPPQRGGQGGRRRPAGGRAAPARPPALRQRAAARRGWSSMAPTCTTPSSWKRRLPRT